jgi:DcmR-like sensory protein
VNGWQDVLRRSTAGDHIVQVYQDRGFLAEAVAEYAGWGLRRGDAVVVIARPEHRQAFVQKLEEVGFDVDAARAKDQIVLLDADVTLAKFMQGGLPRWKSFHETVGGVIAEMRLQFPAVRAYGEMVDILWQRDERDAAVRLEEFWNELARLQTFSLFCAYFMDNLDSAAYGGPLECVCKVHSHLIPVRDYARFDEAVSEATGRVLDPSLAQLLQSLSQAQRSDTQMPLGQAVLLWLRKNMPASAERVLSEIRARG